ncbi:MAG: SHOCT domain-containing protein [Bacilli bacterium]
MMGFGYGSNFSPLFGLLWMGGMGIFWLLIVGAIIWGIVYFSRRQAGATGDNRSLAILRERYARGEIDDDEYERRLKRLQ